jgi:hypothetical protein
LAVQVFHDVVEGFRSAQILGDVISHAVSLFVILVYSAECTACKCAAKAAMAL